MARGTHARRWRRPRTGRLGHLGLRALLLCASVTASAPAASSSAGAAIVERRETVPPNLDLDAAAAYSTGMFGCLGQDPEACVLERGQGPHLFVFGDSNAAMLMPMFRQLAVDHDLTLSAATAAGCTWQRGIGWEDADPVLVEACDSTRQDVYDRVLPALTPDLLVGMHIPRDDPGRGPSPAFIPIDPALGSGAEAIAAATNATLDGVEGAGMRMLIVEPVPYGAFDPLRCLSGATKVSDCQFYATVEPTPTELLYREQAEARADVFTVDLDPVTCPGKPTCQPIVDGDVVFRDAFHVHPLFLLARRAEVWELVTETGALD